LQEKQEEPGDRPGAGGGPDQAEGIWDIGKLSFRFVQFFVQGKSFFGFWGFAIWDLRFWENPLLLRSGFEHRSMEEPNTV
jgi:hypothetical protein